MGANTKMTWLEDTYMTQETSICAMIGGIWFMVIHPQNEKPQNR